MIFYLPVSISHRKKKKVQLFCPSRTSNSTFFGAGFFFFRPE
jgi:hypothetical protein